MSGRPSEPSSATAPFAAWLKLRGAGVVEIARAAKDLAAGQVEIVTWIDRLARPTFHRSTIVKRMVYFRSLTEPWADTGISTGRLMIAVTAASRTWNATRSAPAPPRSRQVAGPTIWAVRPNSLLSSRPRPGSAAPTSPRSRSSPRAPMSMLLPSLGRRKLCSCSLVLSVLRNVFKPSRINAGGSQPRFGCEF